MNDGKELLKSAKRIIVHFVSSLITITEQSLGIPVGEEFQVK
jgi:hypothetical protein